MEFPYLTNEVQPSDTPSISPAPSDFQYSLYMIRRTQETKPCLLTSLSRCTEAKRPSWSV